MILFSNTITPRLQYISNFISNEIIGKEILITTNIDYFKNYSGAKINYSNHSIDADEFTIRCTSLLFEKTIQSQTIRCFEFEKNKVFFPTSGDIPFDIFAASFYLISRYEEYIYHEQDKYGRFAFEQSVAAKENFLAIPLVSIWLQLFKKALQQKFPNTKFREQKFTLQLTYDIDLAYAFLYKPWWKNLGGLIKSAVYKQWNNFFERIKVTVKKAQDPFDSFSWLENLHDSINNVHPIYFFHVGSQFGKYDKNIPPAHPSMRQLIKRTAEKYTIGVHPSWKSNEKNHLLLKEIQAIAEISQKKILRSRQHYLRISIPETYRRLITEGITEDYSMGYGTINGFRASVASSFYWYDLQKETTTQLRIHPFCFMDATTFYQQQKSPQQAFEEMNHFYQQIKKVGGTMIMIWHNSVLGTQQQFNGWREQYEQFVLEHTSEKS